MSTNSHEKTAFEMSTTLLANMEHKLLRDKQYFWLFDALKRQVYLPFKLLFEGMNLMIYDVIRIYIMVFIGTLLIVLFFKVLGVEILYQNTISITMQVLFYISLIATIFTLPSALSKYGVGTNHVNMVVQELTAFQVSEAYLAAIQKNLQTFETGLKKRLLFFRAILGLFWSLGIFMFTKEFELLYPAQKTVVFSTDIVMYMWILLFLFFILESYSKGNAFIFRSLEFGINEYECKLQNSSERPEKTEVKY